MRMTAQQAESTGSWEDKMKVKVKSLNCARLYDPMDCSLPGSFIHEIFEARLLERVAISFSRGSSQPRDQTRVSRIAGRLFTIWATRSLVHVYFHLSAQAGLYEVQG